MALSARELAAALGGGKEVKQGNEWVTCCPAHDDHNPSLSIKEEGGKLLFHCFSGCANAAVVEALISRGLWEEGGKKRQWKVLPEAPENKRNPTGLVHWKYGPPSQLWEYRNRQGKLVGYIYRFNLPNGKKEFMPLSWCEDERTGERAWWWKAFLKPRLLYNEHLLDKEKTKPILLVEGEKACDAATKLFPDYLVMSWPGGSGAVRYVNWEVLKGRDVTLWPDADEAGKAAMTYISNVLHHDVKVNSVKLVVLPEYLPHKWDLADEPPEGFDRRVAVITAKEFEPSGDQDIDEFNQHHAVTMLGGKCVVIRELPDKETGQLIVTYSTPADIRALFKNKPPVPQGRKSIPLFDYWLEHPRRRTYERVVFEPGLKDPNLYNLWQGFVYEPDPTGDWSLFRDHLLYGVAQGDLVIYNWIFGWFAQIFQQPRIKPRTALAIRGPQGAGKSVIGEHMGALMPIHHMTLSDPNQILGNFNSHLAQLLLLQSDEAFFAANPSLHGRLRDMVTNKKQPHVPKGKDLTMVNSYMRMFITSNHDWVVPAAFEERRFAVLDCGVEHVQDEDYFKAMEDQLKNGGYEGLLYELLNFDLTCINLGRIPNTKALQDQKKNSLEPVPKFWYERLYQGELEPGTGKWEQIFMEDLFADFEDRCKTWRVRSPGLVQFSKIILNFLPGGSELKRKRARTKAFNESTGTFETLRPWFYYAPPLNLCRKKFEDVVLQAPENWEQVEEVEEVEIESVEEDLPF